MHVLVHGAQMPRVRTRSVEWLLALLALRHGRTVSRTWLAGTIWPESMESQALANLRHDLVTLRKAIRPEEQRIQSPTRDTLRFDLEGAEVDVVRFDRAVDGEDESSLRDAVAAYAGPLLEGCYEEWVLTERESRARRCLEALERLADGELKRENPAEAIGFLRRAQGLEPLRDSIVRRLMSALEQMGDPASAVGVYRGLRERLHAELSTAPDPDTTRLFHQIRQRAHRKPDAPVVERSTDRELTAGGHDRSGTAFARPPLPIARLIGREQEVCDIEERIADSRLVTLVGAGGMGKTRLAIEVANRVESRSPGTVLWVELAPLAAGSLVLPALAGALEIRQPGPTDSDNLMDGVAQRLSGGETFAVLDNCEHLLDSSAELVQQLLSRCSALTVLVTSRQRLGIAGEVTWHVPPLPVADPDQLPAGPAESAQAARAAPAVRLFLERAVAARADFQLATREDVEAVCRICRRLDGIPLAVELAAARARSLTVIEIQSKLDHRFSLLTGGSRTAMPRHRTLKSLIDWSYDLLSGPEKQLLGRLSAFAGGWTAGAAENVCSGDGVERTEMLDLLSSLVDQSLVVAETAGSSTRYHLLETVRQYAREILSLSGEEAAWRNRHLQYFSALADEAEPNLWTGSSQAEWLDRLETENDNLRAGLDWAAQAPDRAIDGLRTCGALWRFWIAHPRLFEGQSHLTRALTIGPHGDSRERGRALTGAGNLATLQGDFATARRLLQECLDMRRRLGDDPRQIAGTLVNLAAAILSEEDLDEAKPLLEEALSIYREQGERWLASNALGNLGTIASLQGDHTAARDLYEECLSIQREFGDQWSVSMSLHNLGITAYDLGDFGSARDYHTESLTIRSQTGDSWGIASSLGRIAAIEAASGSPQLAARLWGASESLRYEIGTPLPSSERTFYDQQIVICRSEIGDDEAFDNAWEEGGSMPMEGLLAMALRSELRPISLSPPAPLPSGR
jgi:predicted ATPase/DNA-binding SARP family transcriptional activator